MQEQEAYRTLLASALSPIETTHSAGSRIWIVWLALAFIAGTLFGQKGIIVIGSGTIFLLGCALFLELVCHHFFTQHSVTLTFTLALLFVFTLGVERSTPIYTYSQHPIPPPQKLTALVVLTEPATTTKLGDSYPAHLVATLANGKQTPYNIRGRVLFPNTDSSTRSLRIGHRVLATIDFVQNAGSNPNGFDLVAWQLRRGELFTGRVARNSVQILGTDSTITPPLFASLRARIITSFAQAGLQGNALELVKTMSIGAREELPAEVRDNFSRSGIAHLLALSGLHLGFIYAFFAFFFHLIPIDRLFKRIVREIVPLLATWLFVLVAGASPSLLRAAIMLSIWSFSRIFFLYWHSLDVLALAAIVILWLSPATLYDLGFQLSFSALLGLILFYPVLKPYTYTRFRPLTWGLQLLCVSLCAQIGTLPITLHVFGTLPLFSLFTNILAIPLAAVIVSLALLITLVPLGGTLAQLGGTILQYCADALLWISEHVSTLPSVTLSGLRIPLYIAYLLASIFVFAGVFVLIRRRWSMVASMAFVLAFLGALCAEIVQTATTAEVVVYQQTYGTTVSIREGRNIQGVYLQNSRGAAQNITRYANGVWGATITIDSAAAHTFLTPTEYGYIVSKPLQIAIPLGRPPSSNNGIKQPTDLLLLTRGCEWRASDLLMHFAPHEVVIDGSYPRWRLEAMAGELVQHGVRVHNTRSNGAWMWRAKRSAN